MKTERLHDTGDRYQFDFGLCTIAKGWAQVDTSQDASYFGTWANPTKLWVVNFCEGDVTISRAESADEFVAELRGIRDWNQRNGHRFIGIDPGFSEELRAAFEAVGAGDLLHARAEV